MSCVLLFELHKTLEWGGLDTIILTAGVSALQPILGVAGVEDVETATELDDIGKEGIEKAMSATEMATRINYYGPLLVALTFVSLNSLQSSNYWKFTESFRYLSSLAPQNRPLFSSSRLWVRSSLALLEHFTVRPRRLRWYYTKRSLSSIPP